ncbi:MAG: RNA polymerase factor sigma-32 [Deltaproteobacteria bacterium]|nr:RNA polymerase factor sigma-32 [Deltaproteobacteria bacterium]
MAKKKTPDPKPPARPRKRAKAAPGDEGERPQVDATPAEEAEPRAKAPAGDRGSPPRRKSATARDDTAAGPSGEAHDPIDHDEDAGGSLSAEDADEQSPAERSGPLAPYDPLGAYLREIHRYPLLAQEAEKALAVRYYERQDVDAAAALVTANLRLVVKIAFEYRRAYRNVMDLIQEGNIGLMQAVKKFDPFRGVKLSTYASWWIRAYILRYLLNNWRLVKIGTTQAQRRLFFNLSKEKRRLESLGIDATPQNIAEGLSVTPAEVIEMDRRLSAPEASLDAPARAPGSGGDGDRSATRLDLLSNEDVPTDEALVVAEFNDKLQSKVAGFAETLSGRDADVFRNRLWADKPETLQEIGDRYSLTREGVRQIEKRILARLRKFLEEQMGDYLDFER